MSWERELADRVAASATPAYWQQLFTQDPDVMHDLLADLHKAANGTRPPTLDSLWSMLAPRFTNDPLDVAVKALLAEKGLSLRWLAKRVGIARPPLQRMLAGEFGAGRPPEQLARIEAIAEALGVHPSFFCEWRRLWFMQLLDAAFRAHPNLSAALYPKFAGHEVRGRPTLISQEAR